MVQGPPRGYFLDPTKSILIVSPQNVLRAEALFWRYGLQVVMGSRYLGGFIGTETAQDRWMEEKVVGWRDLVATLAGVERWHPQTDYTVLQKSLQQEWAFVQHVTPGIGMDFKPVEDELRVTFLPDLFQEDTSQILRRAITGMPFKQAGIALPNPIKTSRDNCIASYVITGHLVAALGRTAEFRLGDNSFFMREGREEIQQRHAEAAEIALGEARADASTKDAHRMGRIQRTRAWLSVNPSTVNGKELGA